MQRLSSSRGVSIPACHRTRELQFHDAEHHHRGQAHKHDRKRRQDDRKTHPPHTQGWRFAPDAILPGHRRAHWWVLARTSTVNQCPHCGQTVGGHNKLHATPPTLQNQDYRDTLWLPTWQRSRFVETADPRSNNRAWRQS